MQELRPGLWTWTAPHPEWTPEHGGPDGWEEDVRCYAFGAADGLVLVDPLDPPDELRSRASVALLTVWYHERSAPGLGLPVHVPAADLARVDGAEPYRAGDVLPGGVEAKDGYYPGEPVLWIPAYGALVSGDTLLGDGDGGIRLLPDSWLPEGTTRGDVAERLRPLLELPVELVLPGHGEPVTEDAPGRLRGALA